MSEWKKIWNVEVSECGRARCPQTKEEKTLHDNGGGYFSVNVKVDGKDVLRYIHRLVAECFLDNPKGLKYVGHIDHDKSNNHKNNLEWITASQNTKDGVKAGRINYKGRCKNGMVTHTPEVICAAYVDVARGGGLMEISRKHGVNRTSLASWVKKKSHKDLTDLLDEMLSDC